MLYQNVVSLNQGSNQKSIAIIGMGPRGLSVLERLAYYINAGEITPNVRILLIDDTEMAAGRIWRTDQPKNLLMNTLTSQMTLFSGDRDTGADRPGAGPSLSEWLADQKDENIKNRVLNDYATRGLYGHYMKFVYQTVLDSLPQETQVKTVCGSVQELDKVNGVYHLNLSNGETLAAVDKVLIATGHPKSRPGEWEDELKSFADKHEGCLYLQGDSAADIPLKDVKSDSKVALIGMGLGFYDILISLTQDRGGHFVEEGGELTYVSSGMEPKIYAGSRSSVPLLSRGINQKKPGFQYNPTYFKKDTITALRKKALSERGTDQLEFNKEILPLFHAELLQTFYKTHVLNLKGQEEADVFTVKFNALLPLNCAQTLDLFERFGLSDVQPIDIFKMARPFNESHFASPNAYRDSLLNLLREDLKETQKGNIEGPIKAMLDTIRDLRDHIRFVVDYEGLSPDSYLNEFLKSFLPVISFLSAGPPAIRVEQTIALIKAGILEVVGPKTEYLMNEKEGAFEVSSPCVAGSKVLVSQIIDTRVPGQNLNQDRSPLMKDMVKKGLIRAHVITNKEGNPHYTGGVDVTCLPFQAIGGDGNPTNGLYLLGIPCEHVRWFTQVGSGTVGVKSTFTQDADATACALLSSENASSETSDMIVEAL